MTIKDLKPALVFSIFDEINHVPRPSKKEEKIIIRKESTMVVILFCFI